MNYFAKHFIFLFLSVIILFNLSCISSKRQSNEKDILGTWYAKKPNSTSRVRIEKNFFISERRSSSQEVEMIEDTQRVQVTETGWEIRDSIEIVEKEFVENESENTISMILVREKDGKNQYNSFLFSDTEVKGIKTVFSSTRKGFETIEAAKKALQEAKFQNVDQELFFSERYVKEVLPTLKPMKNITKKDYIKVVKYVRSFENELMAFAATKEEHFIEGTPYRIDRDARKLAYKKLYFLGYDPYKLPENGEDYMKKFEGDKDIEELNNIKTEIRF